MYYSTPLEFNPVTPEESAALFELIANRKPGYRAAKVRLQEAFLPLAARIARNMGGYNASGRPSGADGGSPIPEEDLVAAANDGLLRAIERYRHGPDACKFTTYAHKFIRGHVLSVMEKWRNHNAICTSLDKMTEPPEDGGNAPVLPEAFVLNPWPELEDVDAQRRMLELLFTHAQLPERHKLFLVQLVDRDMNLAEVARALGMSRERARQLFESIIYRVRRKVSRKLKVPFHKLRDVL